MPQKKNEKQEKDSHKVLPASWYLICPQFLVNTIESKFSPTDRFFHSISKHKPKYNSKTKINCVYIFTPPLPHQKAKIKTGKSKENSLKLFTFNNFVWKKYLYFVFSITFRASCVFNVNQTHQFFSSRSLFSISVRRSCVNISSHYPHKNGWQWIKSLRKWLAGFFWSSL